MKRRKAAIVRRDLVEFQWNPARPRRPLKFL